MPTSLAELGWRPLLQQQLTLEDLSVLVPARVVEQHRSEIEVISERGSYSLPILSSNPVLCVGDWILMDKENRIDRVLDRFSLFSRKAPGSKISEQLIAANVDTAFIVCSLNDDFNLNRIERFLSMVNESSVEAVVVLTKSDLCDEAEDMRSMVQSLDRSMSVISVNALEPAAREELLPWCKPGQTLVLLGSSGAGKSTLTNTLLGESRQLTGDVRFDDSKGRHTTTSRSLLSMSTGAMLLDTPGMRELQLGACEEGIAATFSDVESLVQQCKFNDCGHSNEPGCAVRTALENGSLDQRRFSSYSKLLREQKLNSASLAERRAQDKNLGRFYKKVIGESVKIKRGE